MSYVSLRVFFTCVNIIQVDIDLTILIVIATRKTTFAGGNSLEAEMSSVVVEAPGSRQPSMLQRCTVALGQAITATASKSLENPFKTLMVFKLKVNGDELDVYHLISTRAFYVRFVGRRGAQFARMQSGVHGSLVHAHLHEWNVITNSDIACRE